MVNARLMCLAVPDTQRRVQPRMGDISQIRKIIHLMRFAYSDTCVISLVDLLCNMQYRQRDIIECNIILIRKCMNNISGVPWQPCDLMNRQVVSEYRRARGYIALLNKSLRMSRFLLI